MSTQSTTATEPELVELEQTTALVVQEAETFTIDDQDAYELAGEFLTGSIKPALKEIEARFRPMQRAADATKREILDQRRALEDPLKAAEVIIKQRMGVHVVEQRRIQAEAEAERQRIAREEAEEARLAEAAALEDAGHTEAAQEKIDAPIVPAVVAPAPEKPKATGTSARMVTKYRILNAAAIGREYLMPDDKKIAGVVKAMGADAARLIGGIEVYAEPVISARAR